MPPPDQDIARELSSFLMGRGAGFGGRSALEQRVQTEIYSMASRIAAEIVESVPELEERIREMTRQVVMAALNDDEMLRDTVVRAVSGALGKYVAEKRKSDG
jgi:hypothetical protein